MPYGALARLPPVARRRGHRRTPSGWLEALRAQRRTGTAVGRDLPPAAVLLARAVLARVDGLRALVRALGPLRARLRRRPEAARAPRRAARAGRRALSSLTFVACDRARAAGARGRPRRRRSCRWRPTRSRRRTRRRRSSPSRSATSAGAPTGRCCARSPSGCPSSCCCSSAPGTTTSARTTPTTPRAARTPNLVWLGARTDEEAARLILCADVGIVPFKVEPFNDAGLPYRILKYARLAAGRSRRELAGVRDVVAGGDDRRRRRRVRRRAARERRRAHATRRRAARVGAGADRRGPERAAVGSPAGARGSHRA